MDFTSDMEVLYVLFKKCPTKNRKISLKQHIKYFNFRNTIQLDHPVSFTFLQASPTPSRQRSWRVTRERTTSDKCPRSHSIRYVLFSQPSFETHVQCASSTQSWYFGKHFWHVPLAGGLILQLLCNSICNRKLWKKTKQNIVTHTECQCQHRLGGFNLPVTGTSYPKHNKTEFKGLEMVCNISIIPPGLDIFMKMSACMCINPGTEIRT